MPTATSVTFEDVDKHVQAVDLSALQPGGKHGPAATSAAAVLPNICPAYKAVRPILVLLSNSIFLPQKWRDVLKSFLAVIDVICP